VRRFQLYGDLEHSRACVDKAINVDDNGDFKFKNGQRSVFDILIEARDDEARQVRAFFMSSAGGTGNVYLLNTLIDAGRYNWGREGEEYYDEPSIGLATASTGIAATLLKLGQTFHSTVKAPCTNLNAESCFSIAAGSDLVRVIRDTTIFVWYEVSMAHKHLTTRLDRTFKDLMQDDRPFGGKLVVMSGYFRQNLSIIPDGPEAQITNARLKRSPLWNKVTQLGLTENIRGRNHTEPEISSIEQDNSFLLAMGDRALPNSYPDENPHLVRLPAIMCMFVTDDEAGMSKTVRFSLCSGGSGSTASFWNVI
jgi:hypothetical protein